MTRNARGVERSIKNIRRAVLPRGRLKVTRLARNTGVRTIEDKTRIPLMIETYRRPVVGHMTAIAARAIRGRRSDELPFMDIAMATLALCPQPDERDLLRRLAGALVMTGHAICRAVFPCQRKVCLTMVEGHFRPHPHAMTSLAATGR